MKLSPRTELALIHLFVIALLWIGTIIFLWVIKKLSGETIFLVSLFTAFIYITYELFMTSPKEVENYLQVKAQQQKIKEEIKEIKKNLGKRYWFDLIPILGPALLFALLIFVHFKIVRVNSFIFSFIFLFVSALFSGGAYKFWKRRAEMFKELGSPELKQYAESEFSLATSWARSEQKRKMIIIGIAIGVIMVAIAIAMSLLR